MATVHLSKARELALSKIRILEQADAARKKIRELQARVELADDEAGSIGLFIEVLRSKMNDEQEQKLQLIKILLEWISKHPTDDLAERS